EGYEGKLGEKGFLGNFGRRGGDWREVVFQNADLYPPGYTRVRCETWVETSKPVTEPHRLQPHKRSYPLENYVLWAITETPFGKWRREYRICTVPFPRSKVHMRH